MSEAYDPAFRFPEAGKRERGSRCINENIRKEKNMKNVIVITGASSGIGKEFAVQLDKTEKADEI